MASDPTGMEMHRSFKCLGSFAQRPVPTQGKPVRIFKWQNHQILFARTDLQVSNDQHLVFLLLLFWKVYIAIT